MIVLEILVLSQSGLEEFEESLGEIKLIINYFFSKIPSLFPVSVNQPYHRSLRHLITQSMHKTFAQRRDTSLIINTFVTCLICHSFKHLIQFPSQIKTEILSRIIDNMSLPMRTYST